MRLTVAALAASALAGFLSLADGVCDGQRGPSGHRECVRLAPNFEKHQWAVCLSDFAIRTLTGGKMYCRDRSAKYCWYQCMMDDHGDDAGDVSDRCLCRTDAPAAGVLRVRSSRRTPSNECSQPSGGSCSWYRDCLESSRNRYALKYAEKYCKLYSNNYYSFSAEGRKWIGAVRKCLQMKLVPLLLKSPSCEEIKDKALASHIPCYLDPSPGISVCQLPCTDFKKIYKTIKSSGFWSSVKGGLKIFYECKNFCWVFW